MDGCTFRGEKSTDAVTHDDPWFSMIEHTYFSSNNWNHTLTSVSVREAAGRLSMIQLWR